MKAPRLSLRRPIVTLMVILLLEPKILSCEITLKPPTWRGAQRFGVPRPLGDYSYFYLQRCLNKSLEMLPHASRAHFSSGASIISKTPFITGTLGSLFDLFLMCSVQHCRSAAVKIRVMQPASFVSFCCRYLRSTKPQIHPGRIEKRQRCRLPWLTCRQLLQ